MDIKKISSFSCLILSVLLFSQCKNTDSTEPQIVNTETWTMTGIGCYCLPPLPTFESGEIVWIFNHDNNMLSIENQTDSNFGSGEYSFAIKNDTLSIEFVPDRIDFLILSTATTISLYHDPAPEYVDDEISYNFDLVEK